MIIAGILILPVLGFLLASERDLSIIRHVLYVTYFVITLYLMTIFPPTLNGIFPSLFVENAPDNFTVGMIAAVMGSAIGLLKRSRTLFKS